MHFQVFVIVLKRYTVIRGLFCNFTYLLSNKCNKATLISKGPFLAVRISMTYSSNFQVAVVVLKRYTVICEFFCNFTYLLSKKCNKAS